MTAPLPATRQLRVRRRVLDAIRQRPGITPTELAEATSLKRRAVTDAVSTLLRSGRIRAGQPVNDGRRRCYYPADLTPKTPTHYERKET